MREVGKQPEPITMHGVDVAQADDPEALYIHLGDKGKVLGIGPKDADFSKYGKVKRKVVPPANMDLDDMPSHYDPLSVLNG